MRDAKFYYELGFEHGYAILEESYPDHQDYKLGHIDGRRFRERVHSLCPSIEWHDNGKCVVFKYCLGNELKVID